MTDTTEQLIAATGANVAPRVTPADIEAQIASEHYFTAADGVAWAASLAHRMAVTGEGGEPVGTLELLTFCVLVLRNGFTVTGESACASPENFNAEVGRKVAREKAVDKIWALLGFCLRNELTGQRPMQTTSPTIGGCDAQLQREEIPTIVGSGAQQWLEPLVANQEREFQKAALPGPDIDLRLETVAIDPNSFRYIVRFVGRLDGLTAGWETKVSDEAWDNAEQRAKVYEQACVELRKKLTA